MASTITRMQQVKEGVITIEITLTGKDGADDLRVRTFGDIVVRPSGTFDDPNDLTYPRFIVNAGEPVNFFEVQQVRCVFNDMALTLADRSRRAELWGDAIQLQIQTQLVALRLLTDDVTQTTSISI